MIDLLIWFFIVVILIFIVTSKDSIITGFKNILGKVKSNVRKNDTTIKSSTNEKTNTPKRKRPRQTK